MTKQYTTTQIFQHMSPKTLVAWIVDMDDSAPEELDEAAVSLMETAMHNLFAIVGPEAVDMVAGLEGNPWLIQELIEECTAIDAFGVDKDEPAIEDDYEFIRRGC